MSGINPALAIKRAREAESQAAILESVIYRRALANCRDLANDLHSLSGHVLAGDPEAHRVLSTLLAQLERARAACQRIVLPASVAPANGDTPPTEPAPNG